VKHSPDNPQGRERRGKAPVALTALILIFAVVLVAVRFPGSRSALGRLVSQVTKISAPPAQPPPLPAVSTFFEPKQFDGARAFTEVRDFLGVGPRVSGTEGAEKGALYLAERLKTIGIEPDIDEFTEDTVGGPVTFRNVTGVIQGTGKGMIVLGSHYDTRSGISDAFVGANDSGSSTGILIELARLISEGKKPPRSVMFAFFDGEECKKQYGPNDGLHGSCRLADKLVRQGTASAVKAFILLDMVGDKDLSVTIPLNSSPVLASYVLDSSREEKARDKFSLFQGSMVDDHVHFLKAGMPAIDIIDFEFGSKPGLNDYWHSTEDTLDKLSAESLQTVGRVVLRTMNKLM
jgi:hypothetical protein